MKTILDLSFKLLFACALECYPRSFWKVLPLKSCGVLIYWSHRRGSGAHSVTFILPKLFSDFYYLLGPVSAGLLQVYNYQKFLHV